VGRAAVITNEATHAKKIIFHPKMMPAVVVADPALTLGLPPHVTAATGMDALAHCLEAYCAPGYQKGLGAIHALSPPVGARFDTHHGLTNAVVMPYVLQFNRPALEVKL